GRQDRLAEQVREVLARLAQASALALDLADPEAPADQIVEADPARRHVAPGLAGRQDDPGPGGKGLDLLGLDQGDVAIDLRVVRVVARPERVPIALEADAGGRPDAGHGAHRGAAARGHVDRLDDP